MLYHDRGDEPRKKTAGVAPEVCPDDAWSRHAEPRSRYNKGEVTAQQGRSHVTAERRSRNSKGA
eukprot:1408283-Rhodomonas_salina.1